MNKLRPFLPAFVLLVGCGFVWNSRSQRAVPLATPLSAILPAVDGYTARDTTLSQGEQDVAGMTTYSLRLFRRDSAFAFSTFVSYYDRQSKGKTIHSPKNCLPGAGWEVLAADTTTIVVDGVTYPVNQYTLKSGPSAAVVYYWYQGRGRIVANEYVVKLNLLRDAAFVGHTEEALVRVVVPVAPIRNLADTAEVNEKYGTANALGKRIAALLAHDVAKVIPPG